MKYTPPKNTRDIAVLTKPNLFPHLPNLSLYIVWGGSDNLNLRPAVKPYYWSICTTYDGLFALRTNSAGEFSAHQSAKLVWFASIGRFTMDGWELDRQATSHFLDQLKERES